MPTLVETRLDRRTLAAATLSAVTTTLSGCGGLISKEPTPPIATAPAAKTVKKDIAPTVVSTKETPAQRVLWTEGMIIPSHPSDFRLTRDAFFVADNMVFFTNPQGYSTAYNIEKGRAWRWEEDPTLVYGADKDTVYAFRRDNRLFALDSKDGQKKWHQVFPTMANANVEWPFLICKETVHPRFRPSQQQFPFAGISKETGSVLWMSDGSKRAIGSTQKTIVAEDWYGWGRWYGIDPLSTREKWVIRFEGYSSSERGLIVNQSVIWINLVKGTQGEVAILEDIDSGQRTLVNERTDATTILLVSPTRIYATWATGFLQPGLLVIDRQTGSTTMEGGELRKEDFVGEKDDWFAWTQSKLGQTTFLNVINGATSVNDDLRLTMVAGTVKNIMVGAYQDPSRGQDFLFGIDITSKNAARKWRLPSQRITHLPLIVGNKVVYGSGSSLQVIDGESGKVLAPITLQGEATRILARKDALLVQTGTPGRAGTLSAVRV